MRLFVAMFINTAFIVLLFNFEIVGFKIPELLSAPITKFKNFDRSEEQEYNTDITRGMYVEIGGKIIVAMMINIVFPHFLFFIILPIVRKYKMYKAKK